MTDTSSDDDRWASLGTAIRGRRLAGGLTMVELADRAGLSQPFLSQIENARARPSMQSLYRIAAALGTMPQALFGGPSGAAQPTLARSSSGEVLTIATDGESLRRLLLPGDAPFHVIELVGLADTFLEPWTHEGFEALYVLEGPVDVDVGGQVTRLQTGDFLSYPAALPHRYRSDTGPSARVLLIETQGATGWGAHSSPDAVTVN